MDVWGHAICGVQFYFYFIYFSSTYVNSSKSTKLIYIWQHNKAIILILIFISIIIKMIIITYNK